MAACTLLLLLLLVAAARAQTTSVVVTQYGPIEGLVLGNGTYRRSAAPPPSPGGSPLLPATDSKASPLPPLPCPLCAGRTPVPPASGCVCTACVECPAFNALLQGPAPLKCHNFTIGCAQNAHSMDVPTNKSEVRPPSSAHSAADTRAPGLPVRLAAAAAAADRRLCRYLEIYAPMPGRFKEPASVLLWFYGGCLFDSFGDPLLIPSTGDWKEGNPSNKPTTAHPNTPGQAASLSSFTMAPTLLATSTWSASSPTTGWPRLASCTQVFCNAHPHPQTSPLTRALQRPGATPTLAWLTSASRCSGSRTMRAPSTLTPLKARALASVPPRSHALAPSGHRWPVCRRRERADPRDQPQTASCSPVPRSCRRVWAAVHQLQGHPGLCTCCLPPHTRTPFAGSSGAWPHVRRQPGLPLLRRCLLPGAQHLPRWLAHPSVLPSHLRPVLQAMQKTLVVPLSWSDAIQMWAPVVTGARTAGPPSILTRSPCRSRHRPRDAAPSRL